MADPGAGYLVYGVVLLAVRLGGHSLISRAAPRGTACLSLVMTATGFAGFTFWPSVVMIVVISAGQALGLPAFLAMATEGLPADQRGSVVATVTAFFDIGFLTAALALGAVVQAVGLRYGFAAAGAMAALGLLLFIPNARRSSP
jgi:predicted MFS family arabinose efflux permease